jgi:uncharacterized protein YegL
MNKFLRLVMATIFVLLGTWQGGQAFAQGAALSLRVDRVDLTSFPDVSVHLRAWDSAGLPLSALTTDDFTLVEDQGAPLRPLSIKPDLEAPVRVVLVMDVSGSMAGQPFEDAKQAATRFLDRLKPGDQVALIAFSDSVDPDPTVLDPARELAFTSDLSIVYDTIENLKLGKNTHLYLALVKAMQMIAQTPSDTTRVVLLLTDGRNEPNNVGDPQEPIRLAQEVDVPVFVVGLGDKIDETYLRTLASESGGVLRTTPRSSELAALFGDMATLLKTQYLLNYRSALPQDGAKHTLTVQLNTSSASAESRLEFGPLPLVVPEATPTTAVIPTQPVETGQVPIANNPSTTPAPLYQNWVWLGAAVVSLGLGLLIAALRRRRPKPAPEVCAQCGFDLTGIGGACPQCGGTRRLPRTK